MAITWTTPGNTKISLAIVTEQPSLIDQRVTVPCYDLQIRVGHAVWGGAELIEHPQHGTVLKAYTGGSMVKVPAEDRAAVAALLADYNAEIERRSQTSVAADRAYQAHRAVMRKVLGTACVDE